MKLQELIKQGYVVSGWMRSTVRGECRVAVKLTRRNKFYVVHAPYTDAPIINAEFTAPILVK